MKPSARMLSLFLPAGLLAGWMALADGQETPKLSVCRHRAGDGQDAGPVDLSRVDREYTKAAKAFRERMKVTEERTAVYRDQGHNAGVKACVRAERRDVTLRDPLPAKLCGRRLYFLSVPRGDRLPSGLPVPLEPEAVVFLLEYASLEDAGKLARRLNVGVTPATTALAQRLGLRCLASVVDVDGDGKRLTIQEIAP